MRVDQQFLNTSEQDAAIARGLAHGFLKSPLRFKEEPRLSSANIRRAVAEKIQTAWSGPWTGLCQMIVNSCIGTVEDHFSCKAWPTYGWVTDVDRGDIWRMDTDKLCAGLKDGTLGLAAEFHTWITLDTGEIVDPTVYRTLAELYPSKFGDGKNLTNTLNRSGRQYEPTPSLPFFQYHPSVYTE